MSCIYPNNDAMGDLLEEIASAFEIDPQSILKKGRKSNVTDARAVFFTVLRRLWGWGLMELEREFGFNHSTIVSYQKKCMDLYKYDKNFRERTSRFLDEI